MNKDTNMSDYITAIIGTLSTIMSAYLSHIITKRRYNAEVDNQQIRNMSDALIFYKDVCDDNRERLNVLYQSKKEQDEQIKQIQLDMLELRTQICKTPNCKLRTS